MSTPAQNLHNYCQNRNDVLTWSETPSGPSDRAVWTVECKVNGRVVGAGIASQKAVAKQNAARQALEAIRQYGGP